MSYMTGDGGSLIRRPDAVSIDYLTCYCVGPIHTSDPSVGLLNRVWKGRATLIGEFLLSRSTKTISETLASTEGEWEPETQLFVYSGAPIVETDMAFDQNGNVMVCAERFSPLGGAPEIWLYWFDPRAGQHVFNKLCQGRNPRLLLDAPENVEESDVLLFYISDESGQVEMRQQRDLFDIVYPVPVVGTENKYLGDIARAVDGRMHLIYFERNVLTGRYSEAHIETAPYPIRIDDAVTTNLSPLSVEVRDVVKLFDFDESIKGVSAVIDLTVVELLVEKTVVAENVRGSSSTRSVTVEDLVMQRTISAESVAGATSSRSITLVVVVLEAPALATGNMRGTSTPVSITVSTA